MPEARMVVDSLSRALCPSLDATALARALHAPSPFAPRPVPTSRTLSSRRNHATLASWKAIHEKQTPKCLRIQQAERKRSMYLDRVWKRNPSLPKYLFSTQDVDDSILDPIDSQTLLFTLRELLHIDRQYHKISQIVRYLVTKRHQKPDAFLYECIIKANLNPDHGSAEVVKQLLKEMEDTGIVPTVNIYHSVLSVLAVHPDYTLRDKILHTMKQASITLTSDGHIARILGLLRDGQHEMALEKLEDCLATNLTLPPWLYNVFLHTFAESGMCQEALMILQHELTNAPTAVTSNAWCALLEAFSRDAFYEGVKYVWGRQVISGSLNPSDGTVVNVLNCASGHGDMTLAVAAIKILTARGRRLGLHHFEPLLELHARGQDLTKAFQTLCLMQDAGLHPDSSSTRTVYCLLRDDASQLDQALTVLHELRPGHQVPIAAFNVVLEATILHKGLKAALDLYRNVRSVCDADPDATTYQLLLHRCTMVKTLRFIFAEMEAFNIKADRAMCDRAIMICTLSPNYEMAFQYLDMLTSCKTEDPAGTPWMSRDVASGLIRRCINAEDYRVQDLLQQCRRRGIDPGLDLDALLRRRSIGPEGKSFPSPKDHQPEPTAAEHLAATVAG